MHTDSLVASDARNALQVAAPCQRATWCHNSGVQMARSSRDTHESGTAFCCRLSREANWDSSANEDLVLWCMSVTAAKFMSGVGSSNMATADTPRPGQAHGVSEPRVLCGRWTLCDADCIMGKCSNHFHHHRGWYSFCFCYTFDVFCLVYGMVQYISYLHYFLFFFVFFSFPYSLFQFSFCCSFLFFSFLKISSCVCDMDH